METVLHATAKCCSMADVSKSWACRAGRQADAEGVRHSVHLWLERSAAHFSKLQHVSWHHDHKHASHLQGVTLSVSAKAGVDVAQQAGLLIVGCVVFLLLPLRPASRHAGTGHRVTSGTPLFCRCATRNAFAGPIKNTRCRFLFEHAAVTSIRIRCGTLHAEPPRPRGAASPWHGARRACPAAAGWGVCHWVRHNFTALTERPAWLRCRRRCPELRRARICFCGTAAASS